MDSAAGGLVGRDDALARVERAVAAGGTVFVSGPAGMGKTALLRAALAAAGDVDAGWGTCVEDGRAPGYWPWTQALNGLVRAAGADRAREAAGAGAGLLATLAPALGDAAPPDESDRARMLLLDTAAAWLHALAAVRPVVVVLDDLQWVDDSSLALLEVVAGDARPSPVCVLGAFRPDEVPPALRGRLNALVARAAHVPLSGLDRAATARLVHDVAGGLPEETVEAVFRRAGGHPFFTRELALAAADGVPDEQVPAAVRDAVERRVHALPLGTREVLRAAALAGSWLPDVLGAVTGRTPAEVDEAAAGAVAAGLLVPGEDGRPRFAHDLFRETVAAAAGPAPGLHLAIGDALAARAERSGDVSPSEVARHYRAALPSGGLEPAVRWALRAAEVDRAALALAEAAAHLRRLRGAVADAGLALPDDLAVDVLLAEADALARAGRTPDARGLVRAARDAAERLGDGVRTARAALAAAALGSRFAVRRDDVVAELESALAAVSDPVSEARLTAALARELQHSVPEQRARAGPLSERALALGRASGDRDALADCLLARHDVLWGPGTAAARAEVAAELVALAAGDPERHAEALLLQANALLESGSAAFAPVLEECLATLSALGQPRHLYTVETRRACLALLAGRLDEAAERIDAGVALGERLREPDTGNVAMSQRLELVRARSVPEELAAFAREAVAHWTGAPVHAHAVAAGFSARAGDLDAARRYVAAVHDLGTWRSDASYLRSVFVRELAYAAVALGELALCAELLAEVRPLTGTCGVNGAVVAFAGCHSYTAGLLARALGEPDAEALLAEARAVHERLGAVADGVPPGAALRRRGAVWEVAYGGRVATVPHAKGLSDIAALVRRPGADVHVLDLVGAGTAGTAEVTDRTAAEAYRRRLAELSAERLDAEAAGDEARLRAVEEEHDALVAELRGGTGLGGRPREFANHPAERARKAVAARVRDAVRRIGEVLPDLGAHLDATLVTGVRCRYRGDERWAVET